MTGGGEDEKEEEKEKRSFKCGNLRKGFRPPLKELVGGEGVPCLGKFRRVITCFFFFILLLLALREYGWVENPFDSGVAFFYSCICNHLTAPACVPRATTTTTSGKARRIPESPPPRSPPHRIPRSPCSFSAHAAFIMIKKLTFSLFVSYLYPCPLSFRSCAIPFKSPRFYFASEVHPKRLSQFLNN